MAGYSDTRQLIIDTLMGRPAGTEIQPEDHQAFALALNDYIRSVELVAGSSVPVDFAEPNTVPVQPNNGQAVYLSYVPRSTTKNFVNFINQSGNSISVTSSSGEVKLVTLLWNGSYWSSQIVTISVLSDDSSVNTSNIGASDYILFSTSSNYSIGDIVRYDGKLYKFTTKHAAGAWIGTDVQLASINSILTIKLTDLDQRVAEKLSELEKYDANQDRTINGLRDQVENYKPIIIEGDVTNAPDEIDITSNEQNLLQFKNRSSLDGMGYVILRKNKTFAEQVIHKNTIYEIRYNFDLNTEEVEIPANCVLNFNGGKLSNGTLIGNVTTIDSHGIEIFTNLILHGSWANTSIYTKWWSNKDNVLCNSLSAMMKGHSCYVEFESGKTYTYTYLGNTAAAGYTDPLLRAEDCDFVEINFNGSIQKIEDNASLRYTILQIVNCNSAYIHDGEIVGDRINHDYTPTGSHEFGYGVHIMGKNAKLERLNIHDFTGDGLNVSSWYNYHIGSYVSEVDSCYVINCEIHHCRRQGITYGGCKETTSCNIIDCHIHDIGTSNDIAGTAPMAGIDVEPENPEKVTGTINLDNTLIENCTTSAIICSKVKTTVQTFNINNSIIKGSTTINNSSKLRINDSIVYVQDSSIHTWFYNEVVTNCDFVLEKSSEVIYLHGIYDSCSFVDISQDSSVTNEYSSTIIRTSNKAIFKNCYFKHIIGRVPNPSTYQYPYANTGFGESIDSGKYEFYGCTLENCSAQFNEYDVVLKDCKIIGGAYLRLNKCDIEGCNFINVMQMGTIYHEIGTTILRNCNIKEEFGDPLSYTHFLTLGNNTNKLKLINCILDVSVTQDATTTITANMFNLNSELSSLTIDVPSSVSLNKISAYNSVIHGNRSTFDGEGENSSYMLI